MIITYNGGEFFKIQHGEKVIAFNPISKKSKLQTSQFGSDVCLITNNHPDMNGDDQVSRKDREPFVIKGPGEYEVQDFFIKGFLSKTEYGGSEGINTIYSTVVDGITIAFLGALSETDLSPEAKEHLGEADILFVPIGGEGVLEATEAYKMAVKREPHVIIPMHYGDIGDKKALDTFLKEGGAEKVKPLDKLTIKKKDLLEKKGEIIVLSAQK